MTVLSYGTMVHVALAAAQETGIDAEIIDLRTLLPLDIEPVIASVKKTGRCVIVHEATRTGRLRRRAFRPGAGALLSITWKRPSPAWPVGTRPILASSSGTIFPGPLRVGERCGACWRTERDGPPCLQAPRHRRRNRGGGSRQVARGRRRHLKRGTGAGRPDDRQGHSGDRRPGCRNPADRSGGEGEKMAVGAELAVFETETSETQSEAGEAPPHSAKTECAPRAEPRSPGKALAAPAVRARAKA